MSILSNFGISHSPLHVWQTTTYFLTVTVEPPYTALLYVWPLSCYHRLFSSTEIIFFDWKFISNTASLFISPLSLYRLSLYTASLFIPPIIMPDPWMAVLGGLTEQTRTFNTLSKSVTFDIFWRNIILLHDKLRVYFGFTLFWFILVNCNH